MGLYNPVKWNSITTEFIRDKYLLKNNFDIIWQLRYQQNVARNFS